MYKKIIDPEDSYVSDLLKEGYTLHSVTPFGYDNKQLAYHFIKEYAITSEPTLRGLIFKDVNKIKDNTITEDDWLDNINWHENQ